MIKNKLLIGALLVCGLFSAVAQQESDPSAITTANSQITEVRLDGFEDASFWKVAMPLEQGVISRQSRVGRPSDISSDAWNERDERYGIPNVYAKEKVLGVKVEYMKRGHHWFSLKPQKPIMIEGILNFLAILEEASTNISAPFIKATKPTNSKIIFNIFNPQLFI